jgi:hypothetical protein
MPLAGLVSWTGPFGHYFSKGRIENLKQGFLAIVLALGACTIPMRAQVVIDSGTDANGNLYSKGIDVAGNYYETGTDENGNLYYHTLGPAPQSAYSAPVAPAPVYVAPAYVAPAYVAPAPVAVVPAPPVVVMRRPRPVPVIVRRPAPVVIQRRPIVVLPPKK